MFGLLFFSLYIYVCVCMCVCVCVQFSMDTTINDTDNQMWRVAPKIYTIIGDTINPKLPVFELRVGRGRTEQKI